ncbi:MAG: N-acetylneuraminate synthase family protein [Bacteroidetes bacterium]|nr:N-acetylneuraminate synthase family protein [Bacteroidota bacterium]
MFDKIQQASKDFSPIIIAEIGAKYADLSIMKKMVQTAKDCGADMVKFQTYEAETISTIFSFVTSSTWIVTASSDPLIIFAATKPLITIRVPPAIINFFLLVTFILLIEFVPSCSLAAHTLSDYHICF